MAATGVFTVPASVPRCQTKGAAPKDGPKCGVALMRQRRNGGQQQRKRDEKAPHWNTARTKRPAGFGETCWWWKRGTWWP
jgi:hypothetical protein